MEDLQKNVYISLIGLLIGFVSMVLSKDLHRAEITEHNLTSDNKDVYSYPDIPRQMLSNKIQQSYAGKNISKNNYDNYCNIHI